MILTPEEIKIVRDFLMPAVKNGLIDAGRLNELLKLAASGGESRSEAPEKLYTVKEAAELLGCHPKSIYRYFREGYLHKVRFGVRAVRISQKELEQLLK